MKKTTLFIAAACPSSDVHAARIMKQIRVQRPDTEFRFVGIGGPEMGHEGLEGIGINSSAFIYKQMFPTKNFYRPATQSAMHPVHMYKRFVNWNIYNKLQPKLFDIIQNHHPSGYITFENEFFMMGFYKRLRKAYNDYNRICPPLFYHGLTQKDQCQATQKYMDHMFTRVAMKQSNYERFIFPHTQVGWDGLYRAYHYLLSKSTAYKELATADQIVLPMGEGFRFEDFVADLVQTQRNAFRKNHGINEEDLVLFLATGNTEKEIPFSLKTVRQAIENLLKLEEMQHFPKESLKLVISVPDFVEYKTLASKTIQGLKWPVKVIVAENEDAKFQAMAGSDVGIAVNGQIVSECAAFQLPTLVLDSKPIIQSYFTQMYNSFDSDLNIAAYGTIYPELLMSSIPNKIAYSILEHYQDPKLRYYYAKKHSPILLSALATNSKPINSSIENKFGSVKLGSYQSTYGKISDTILAGADTFDHIHAITKGSISQNEELRINAFQQLGWAKGI